ncbi:MAG: alpha/beta hydrolase [Cyanobacteria bacterium]|nr:alpha/beta hydrolase [Cyanobacteriota bacterium]
MVHPWLSRPMRRRDRLRGVAIAPLTTLMIALGSIGSAEAAERLVLRYGPFSGAIATADLVALAERGELSPALEAYLILGKQSPEQVREILNQGVAIDADWLDSQLKSPWGRTLLDQVGEGIQGPNGEDNRQALEEALTAAARNDGRITVLDVLQQYPGREVHVRVDRLLRIYEQVQELRDRFNALSTRLPQERDRTADSRPLPAIDVLIGRIGTFALEIIEQAARLLDR